MTVRVATLDDVPALMELAHLEHAVSRFSGVPFEDEQASATFRRFLTELHTVVFKSDRGFLMGLVQPLPFSRRWMAYEVAWLALDGEGLQLLRAFEGWAARMRAVEVVVHNYAGIVEPQIFAKVMQRKGFARLGESFIKPVGRVA